MTWFVTERRRQRRIAGRVLQFGGGRNAQTVGGCGGCQTVRLDGRSRQQSVGRYPTDTTTMTTDAAAASCVANCTVTTATITTTNVASAAEDGRMTAVRRG